MVAVLGLSMLIALSPAGVLAQKDKVVDITLEPATVTAKKADTFTLTIQARLGGQKVGGIEIHLDFDPTYLEVVDADLSKSGVQIEPGTTLPTLLSNNLTDNSLGEIIYAAGVKLESPPNYPTTDLAVATVTFLAKSSGNTSITFSTGTDASFEGGSVLRSVAGAGVGIDVAPIPPATVAPPPPAIVTPPPPAVETPPATVTPPPPAVETPPVTVTPIPVTPTPPAIEPPPVTVTPTPPVAPVKPVPVAPASEAPSALTETPEPASEAPSGVAWWVWLIVGVVLVGVGGYVIARRVVY